MNISKKYTTVAVLLLCLGSSFYMCITVFAQPGFKFSEHYDTVMLLLIATLLYIGVLALTITEKEGEEATEAPDATTTEKSNLVPATEQKATAEIHALPPPKSDNTNTTVVPDKKPKVTKRGKKDKQQPPQQQQEEAVPTNVGSTDKKDK